MQAAEAGCVACYTEIPTDDAALQAQGMRADQTSLFKTHVRQHPELRLIWDGDGGLHHFSPSKVLVLKTNNTCKQDIDRPPTWPLFPVATPDQTRRR